MILHRDIRPQVSCGGQVASGDLFGTDYWCVYCGAKWSDDRVTDATSPYIVAESGND